MAGVTVHAQEPFYYVSGKVIDHKTGKGMPGIYVAFQGRSVAAFFGGTEYFDDLALDSTDKNGNFKIKVPAAIADSFTKEHSGPFGKFDFALDVRTARSSNWADLTPDQRVISELFEIEDSAIINKYHCRITINQSTRIYSNIIFLRKDITNVEMPLCKGSLLQFVLPKRDTGFYNNNYLYVSVQQLANDGSIQKQGHTMYSKYYNTEPALVPPHVPLNIVLAKMPVNEQRMDTLTIIKNVSLQPGELKKIRVPLTH
jgi:hypothetical protein